MSTDKTILAVDLDNTLINTDMIFVGLEIPFFKKFLFISKAPIAINFQRKNICKKISI